MAAPTPIGEHPDHSPHGHGATSSDVTGSDVTGGDVTGGDVVGGASSVDVSVVVLSKDEPEIDASLDDLTAQCLMLALDGVTTEIVVIDASEHRLDHIRDNHPDIRWVAYRAPFAKPSTIPEQRNTGVREARGRIVAYCDAGGRPDPAWLRNLTAPLLSGELTVTCGPVYSTRPGVYRTMNDVADRAAVRHVLTANVAFTRDAYDAVDGFDERYAYGSDADFAWRLTRAGHIPTNISDARMGMDWGEWTLQKKRSWRYGRARARLFRFHPQERVKILTDNPEIVAYPGLITTGVTGVFLLVTRRLWQPLALVAAAVAILRYRNRRAPKPWAAMLSHVIYSSAAIWEAVTTKVRLRPTVLHTPKDPGPYQDLLIAALARHCVPGGYLTGPTGSKTLNMLLAPLRAPLLRLGGVRIVHIHWVHEYLHHWSAGRKLAGRFTRMMLRAHLNALHAVGIKVVWTAHNLVPHTKTFDDDQKGRRDLIARTDAVIAHSDDAARMLTSHFALTDTHVIAQGPYPLEPIGRSTARATLDIAENRFVVTMVGRIERYKGFADLLHATAELDEAARLRLVVVVGGLPADEHIATEIETAARQACDAGVDVRLTLHYLDDRELAEAVAAADIVAYPFHQITNSGSVLLALSSRRAALVRDLAALEDLPDDAVIRAGHGTDGLAAALAAAMNAPIATMEDAAERWIRTRSWDATAEATRTVYEQVLAAKRTPKTETDSSKGPARR